MKCQNKRSRSTKEKGLSLIEASMVLALAAVVVAGVMFYYQSASDNNKIQSFTSEIMSVTGGIQRVYGQSTGNADFDGVNNVVMKLGDVPSNYISNGSVINPWGGSLTFDKYTDEYGLKGFKMGAYNIPATACTQLVSYNYGGQLESIIVADQKNPSTNTVIFKNSPTKPPATMAEISDACNQAMGGGSSVLLQYEWVDR